MSAIEGKTVLITGGASGIGLIMGRVLLEAGAKHLIIWDINGPALADAAKLLSASGKSVSIHQLDIAATAKVKEAVQEIQRAGWKVDILINNAGIVVGKSFAEHTHDDIDRTLDINTASLMHITLEILPGMIERGSGHIVNISSAASLISNPNMSVYCASKWAVTGWSDSLRLEMEAMHPQIKVLTVKPYYIKTGMFAGVSSPVIPLLEPEYVANSIIRALRGNKLQLRLPWIVNCLPFLSGVLPKRVFDLVVGKWFGIYKGMSTFKGRG